MVGALSENKMGIIESIRRMLGCKCKEKDLEISILGTKNTELKSQIAALKTESVSPIEEPTVKGTINMSPLKAMLAPHTKNLYLSDINCSTTSKTEAIRFSNKTKVQARKYVKAQHDCDEYSFALAGYWNAGLKQFCFGMAWTETHAFNIMVDYRNQIWIVEPQTNKFTKIEDKMKDKNFYPLNFILI